MKIAMSVLIVAMISPQAHAGWLDGALLDAGAGLGGRAIVDVADKAYENAREAIARPDKPRMEGRIETEGRFSPPSSSDEVRGARRIPGSVGTGVAKKGIRPEDVLSKYDFVPGDRVIFQDDFSDTDVGEFPRRWTLRGPDDSTRKAPIEVARFEGKRWVRFRPSNRRTDVSAIFYPRLNVGKDMPDKFTVEFDAVLPTFDGTDQRPEYRVLLINHGREFQSSDFEATPTNVIRIGSIGASTGNTHLSFERGDGQVHRMAIRVNGASVKAYLDGEMVVNDPEGIVRPVTVIGMELAYQTGAKLLPLMFTDFRVASGGKEMKAALETDGRIVTRGIRFDTGSDVILPSSEPTLSAVRALLAEDSSLKLSVEGHTDSQGTPDVNQPLSERRAKAVAGWLVDHGVASGRLTAKGWGVSRPVAGNDTPEGRAENRRVEFVKFR